MSKSLKELGYVSVGMIVTDIKGTELEVTSILKPSTAEVLTTAYLPQGSDLAIELDNVHYLATDVGWEHLDSRILVLNSEDFHPPTLH